MRKEGQPTPTTPNTQPEPKAVWAAKYGPAWVHVPRIPGWELSQRESNLPEQKQPTDMKPGEPVVLTGVPAKLRPDSQM